MTDIYPFIPTITTSIIRAEPVNASQCQWFSATAPRDVCILLVVPDNISSINITNFFFDLSFTVFDVGPLKIPGFKSGPDIKKVAKYRSMLLLDLQNLIPKSLLDVTLKCVTSQDTPQHFGECDMVLSWQRYGSYGRSDLWHHTLSFYQLLTCQIGLLDHNWWQQQSLITNS